MKPYFVVNLGNMDIPTTLSPDGAWLTMCSLARSRLPYTITSPQLPGYAVHYDGNGKPPYAAVPSHLLSYGGMRRGH